VTVLASAGALAAKGGKLAATSVTIESWQGGVLGEVRTDEVRCGKGRQVIVYRQMQLKRDPSRDQQVGVARAVAVAGAFKWSLELEDGLGPYYAQAQAKPGCKAAVSGVTGSGLGAAAPAGREYPACSPYVSEGASRICRIQNLVIRTNSTPGEQVCYWDSFATGNCLAGPLSGPFPWGGEDFSGQATWGPSGSGRRLTFKVNQRDKVPATLDGTVPGVGSSAYAISDAIAPGEGPYNESDHFYTPNLPGQATGEVGGPLELKTANNKFHGTDFTINGYLYLR